jgi:hypothetical protein
VGTSKAKQRILKPVDLFGLEGKWRGARRESVENRQEITILLLLNLGHD